MTITKEIEIEPDLLNKISEIAKDENKTEDKTLNEALEIGVKIMKKESFFRELERKGAKIANKDTYNPNYDKEGKNAGFIKNIKPFDAVKLIRDVREGR